MGSYGAMWVDPVTSLFTVWFGVHFCSFCPVPPFLFVYCVQLSACYFFFSCGVVFFFWIQKRQDKYMILLISNKLRSRLSFIMPQVSWASSILGPVTNRDTNIDAENKKMVLVSSFKKISLCSMISLECTVFMLVPIHMYGTILSETGTFCANRMVK